MILAPTSPTLPAARSRVRTVLARAACVSAITAMALGADVGTVAAAPGTMLEAPLQSATITGLRQGMTGPQVTELQRALIEAGVTVRGGADGVFGPATKQAVGTFQGRVGLATTGEVDATTAKALSDRVSAAGSGGSAAPASTPGGVVGLARGAKGDLVKKVQQRLVELGVYLAGGADGIFGSGTQKAVTQFQRWNRLEVTGTVTPATAKVLGLSADGATAAPKAPAPTPPAATPTPPAASNGFVGLAQGAKGDLVTKLQRALMNAGVNVRGGADGDFGPATRVALVTFQTSKGHPSTGTVGDRDVSALGLGASAPAPAAPPKAESGNPNSYVGLAVGARGQLVKDVQSKLMAAGIAVRGGADGVFGNATKTALANYQKQKGLSASGSVDAPTASSLGLGSATSAAPSTPAPTATPADPNQPYVGLKVGSSGPQVKELQQALQKTGLVVRGGADGSFGPATRSALILFQRFNGIEQTGVTTARGVKLLGLGSGGGAQGASNPANSPSVTLSRFPVQGQCFFGDTWHAPRGGGRKHVGTDVIANEGKLLYAVTDGEISKQYWDYPGALAGNGLRLAQPNGTYFTYLHMSGFAPGLTVGTKVKAGDVIGYVGNTGSSATPHLHFEIHPGGGDAINPYSYLKAMDDCRNSTPRYQGSFT